MSSTIRRKRKKYEKYTSIKLGAELPGQSSGLENPFQYSGENLEEYTEMATLSPWTPVPDSVARKIFDRADVQGDDVHVELGSGDGRVNYFSIDAGVAESIGIEIDEKIVQVAKDRLDKIHPKPNIKFIVADLMDATNPVWKEIERATILTMYFAREGLEAIQPLLENALRGKRVRIFTCGYEMPGWQSQMVETVLDMPIHFYDWGNEQFEDSIIAGDSFNIPDDVRTPDNMDKFLNKKKKSTYKPDLLKGYHPDDLVDYGWDTFSSEEEEKDPNSNKEA
eukprot:CAMPEP_0113623488 /NCGR_PEP_ID=MMETSP0017_2-20120614/12085_1 /TAXON_ID=2856 /ORGANISM="Cylindrotheca closterium" /LENGTH=279 /DNA_ID=CAMNT_0000533443 /DNA_START=243 /DNA_END=1082 /DNA_ORIENTATION=- /assembly_acc=CAM_ASM_000147